MKTIFCDIDGVIFNQPEDFLSLYNKVILDPYGDLIPGSREKLLEWYTKGYKIILTTGRPSSEYELLKKTLMTKGVYFHQLIMDCGSDQRYIINDIDPSNPKRDKAFGINTIRNYGLKDVSIPYDFTWNIL